MLPFQGVYSGTLLTTLVDWWAKPLIISIFAIVSI